MVKADGTVTAFSEGTAIITARAKDGSGVSATCEVTVVKKMVKSVSLNYTDYALAPGETLQLIATITPENAGNKTLVWSSDNEDVVMVNQSGKVVCLSEGTATVTATTTDGSNLSASCKFNCADGILTITTDGDANLKAYTIDGKVIPITRKGVNIIYQNGQAKKVYVK